MRSRFGLPAVTVTHTLYRSNHALSRCSCHRRFVGSEVRANDLRHTEGLFEKWRPSWGLQGIEKGTSASGLAPVWLNGARAYLSGYSDRSDGDCVRSTSRSTAPGLRPRCTPHTLFDSDCVCSAAAGLRHSRTP